MKIKENKRKILNKNKKTSNAILYCDFDKNHFIY